MLQLGVRLACRLITNFTKQVQLDGVSPKGMLYV